MKKFEFPEPFKLTQEDFDLLKQHNVEIENYEIVSHAESTQNSAPDKE